MCPIGLGVFIEFEDSNAFGMNRLENGVDGAFGLLIEDREIHFYPRRGNGSGFSSIEASLVIAQPGLWHR
jgi:hypothetical protein